MDILYLLFSCTKKEPPKQHFTLHIESVFCVSYNNGDDSSALVCLVRRSFFILYYSTFCDYVLEVVFCSSLNRRTKKMRWFLVPLLLYIFALVVKQGSSNGGGRNIFRKTDETWKLEMALFIFRKINVSYSSKWFIRKRV